MIIQIPGEAIFDLLQSNKAKFRFDYKNFEVKIGENTEFIEPDFEKLKEVSGDEIYTLILQKWEVIKLIRVGTIAMEDLFLHID